MFQKARTKLKEVHPRLIATDVKILLEEPTFLESQLCEVVSAVIAQYDDPAGL